MPEPEIYESAACTINGALLVDNTSIGIQYVDSDQNITLCGIGRRVVLSPGGRYMTVTIGEMFPASGQRFDFIKSYLSARELTLGVQLLGSGKKLISQGFLKAPAMDVAVRQNTQFRVMFVGEAKNFSE